MLSYTLRIHIGLAKVLGAKYELPYLHIPYDLHHVLGSTVQGGKRLGESATFITKVSKVKFTLEQAVKAQRGSRGIALLFL